MSRFSFFRSAKQETASGESRPEFAADEAFIADSSGGKKNSRQNNAADPALPEKKRARRRLVGAVTLALSAIIVLPMVLDPEPKPVSQDVVIDISSRIKSPQAPKKDQDPAQPATPQAASSASAAPAVAVAAVAGAAVAATVGKPKAAVAEPAKPPAKPSESVAPQVVKTNKAASAESKTSEAKTAESVPQGKLIIQVAALATQKKAAELQARLKNAGIKSHTQKLATQAGERIRVRVGPFATRKEADGMCAKLGKIGLQCTLVAA